MQFHAHKIIQAKFQGSYKTWFFGKFLKDLSLKCEVALNLPNFLFVFMNDNFFCSACPKTVKNHIFAIFPYLLGTILINGSHNPKYLSYKAGTAYGWKGIQYTLKSCHCYELAFYQTGPKNDWKLCFI